jgi:hypothetical protein
MIGNATMTASILTNQDENNYSDETLLTLIRFVVYGFVGNGTE